MPPRPTGAPPPAPADTVTSARRPPEMTGRRLRDRYALRRRIGAGGFAEVWEAHDEKIHETVVVKITRLADPEAGRRLLEVAPIEVQLRHPGIVPVLDRDIDGDTLWMVMEKVEGHTFEQLVAELHDRADPGARSTVDPAAVVVEGAARPRFPEGVGDLGEAWLTHMVDALRLLVQAANAVGVAHDRHIVHRDLKPNNIMFESRPEGRVARVIDWGLARVLPSAREADSDRVDIDALHPDAGSVGVPDFLAPERLLGAAGADGPPADVYALGAILYRMLSGRLPRAGRSMRDVRRQVARDPRVPPPHAPLIHARAPEWLAVCAQALDPDPARRPPHGRAFAEALETALWRNRLARYRSHYDRAMALRAEAEAQRADALRRLATVRPWEGVESRRGAWTLQDEADELDADASRLMARWRKEVEGILHARPFLPEAHVLLAEGHAAALRAAEAAGDARAEREALGALEQACDKVALGLELSTAPGERAPVDASADPGVPDRLAALRLLVSGQATLTLVTDRAGVQVDCAPIESVERRWLPGEWRSLGCTPLRRLPMKRGRALLRLTAPGCAPVSYPIHVTRAAHWDGVPPGESGPLPVPMPPERALGPGDVYVPPGPARVGGDPVATDAISGRTLWVDGFVMRRDPVTHRDYIAFLNALVESGLPDAAERHAPRHLEVDDRSSGFSYARGCDGRYSVGDVHPDAPVCLVSWFSARAYAAWYAAREQRPWRLPSEWEYEKAARGTDGRRLPWGDHMEAFRSRLANAVPEAACPAPVDRCTDDVSPYGVRWLAGNMRTWCLDAWAGEGPAAGSRVRVPRPDPTGPQPLRVMRGAYWASPPRSTSAASRFADPPVCRLVTCGLRLVYSCPRGWDPATGRPVG